MAISDLVQLSRDMLLGQIYVDGIVIHHFRVGDQKVMQDGSASQYVCAKLNDQSMLYLRHDLLISDIVVMSYIQKQGLRALLRIDPYFVVEISNFLLEELLSYLVSLQFSDELIMCLTSI